MERLLITKNGALYSSTIAGASANSLTTRDQLNVLQPGGIVWFEKGGVRGTAAGSYTPTAGEAYGVFALGLPTGYSTRVSPMVNMATLVYTKNVYKAAAGMVGVMGDDGVAAVSSGDLTIGTEYVVTTASATASGDYAAGATLLLKNVATGVNLAADTDVTLGQIFVCIATGTPDVYDSAVFTSTQVGTLTTGTKVVGAEYGYRITDLSKETWERRTEDISATLTSASTTDAVMLANLVALHNAHPKASLIATAAVTTGDVGIVFTSVTTGEAFTVQPTGLLYGTTFTNDGTGLTQVAAKGEGTNALILALEERTIGIEGKTSTAQGDELGEVWKVPSLVESGLTYAVYVLTWTDQREVAYVSNNSNPQHKILNIAVPTADTTMITAIDNLLADISSPVQI